jgi:multiple sugar transport system ATP-binding protein
MSGVNLSGIVKAYGAVQVVHGIDLNVAEKEFVVLVGPSGCGKSTTLRMIAGLEEISGGEASIHGKVVNRIAPKDRDVAMVFQNYALYPHLNVADNMAFGLRIRKMPKAEIKNQISEVAEILELTEYLHRKPAELSVDNDSALQWVARLCAILRCSYLMNRCPTLMPSCALRCAQKSDVCTIVLA